jgi:nucleoside-diphosphate-sugar epimerase
MQTILGSGGSIGTGLAKELQSYTDQVRLVSRNPRKVNPTDHSMPGDLMDRESVEKAVRGSEVVYLTAGFPYSIKAWERMWPKAMENTLAACQKSGSRLVFFDNIYLYDPTDLSNITEDTPVNPTSRKGAVRARIAARVLEENRKGNVRALIARAPDFYGPGIRNSVLTEAILNPLKAGKKANWFCSVDRLHDFIWTPDAAKATAILGNDDKAFGEIWHLPTASGTLTGRQWIEAIAAEINAKPRFQVAGKTLTRILGLFNPVMREFVEMLYQYDRDYVFNSNKFIRRYNFDPTPYNRGIQRLIKDV